MAPNAAPLEPTAVVTALLTAAFGPALAGVIGPYAVIILSSLVGGGWALSRREPDTKSSPALFLLLITGTATFVTVGLAVLANHWVHLDSVTWLLAPIGMAIGAVGQDWPLVGKWIAGRIGRKVDKVIDTSSGDKP